MNTIASCNGETLNSTYTSFSKCWHSLNERLAGWNLIYLIWPKGPCELLLLNYIRHHQNQSSLNLSHFNIIRKYWANWNQINFIYFYLRKCFTWYFYIWQLTKKKRYIFIDIHPLDSRLYLDISRYTENTVFWQLCLFFILWILIKTNKSYTF
jgi:hypothetical protein